MPSPDDDDDAEFALAVARGSAPGPRARTFMGASMPPPLPPPLDAPGAERRSYDVWACSIVEGAVGLEVVEKTELRRRSPEGEEPSGLEGAGTLNVKLCMVDGGWSVDAMISTSRGKDN
jgi:hypothetical protein